VSRVFAVVGCGSIGKRHIRNLLSLGKSNIVGVDKDASRRTEAEQLGVTTAKTLAEALQQGVNVVFVTLPNAHHLVIANEAVAAGCDLFMEKPVSSSTEGVTDLIAQVGAKGLVAFVGSNFKFHPSFIKMKQLLDDGEIGRVLTARIHSGQYLPDWHPWEDYRQMYSSRKDLGGGVLLDTHEFIYAVWLLGKVASLACLAEKLSDLEIDTEDTASAVLKMQSGAQVSVLADYNQRPYQRSYEIHGTEGSIYWNIHTHEVAVYRASYKAWGKFGEPEGYGINEMYVDQTRHFLACLDHKDSPKTTLADGLYALQIVEAAKLSSSNRVFVDIP
jgi:predicted dehydrogenase